MLKQCASWLQTKQVLYENTRLRPSFLRRKVATFRRKNEGSKLSVFIAPATSYVRGRTDLASRIPFSEGRKHLKHFFSKIFDKL